jgi:hypothetical protein
MTDVKLGSNWRRDAYNKLGTIDLTPTEANPYEVEMAAVLQQAKQLFLRKNKEYGNAIEYTGVLGAVVAMSGDISRLRNMTMRSNDGMETIELNVRDKLVDILVQAAIGIMMLDRKNFRGKI